MRPNLTKVIGPGSYRYLGKRVQDVDPAAVPIAGKSREAIIRHLKGCPYGIGSTRLRNAFVVETDALRLLYVRPHYTSYRTVAKRVFLDVPFKCDYDHVLGKSIASKLGYSYVLMARISASANRSHGSFERQIGSLHSPLLCFFDPRIKAKARGKNSTYAARFAPLVAFRAKNTVTGGMTIKQKGEWAHAMGVEDFPFNCLALVALSKARP